MKTYSHGIPLHSAIIVRHTPRDHSRALGGRNTGAIAIGGGSVSRGLDYIGREGQYEDRSDIDREPTAYDEVLVEDRLDYIGRLGAYAERGADRQVDATYWNQQGPISREQVEADMRSAGGAYVDSIVAVKREYAESLGLSTKEDMQRLLRCTWQRNVEKWGVIRNPEDIRWVACYHTDADRSVHAHIFTWSARGEIPQGFTVTREGTRAGKEEIYRVGYAGIREDRDVRRNFLRDMCRFEATRQLGLPVPKEDRRRLSETARRTGLDYRLSRKPDVSEKGRKELDALMVKLKESVEGGRGHLSRNWQAYAIARDMVRTLERESPSFRAVSTDYMRCANVMADLKGYGDTGFRRERDSLVRGERNEFLKRVSGKIVRTVVGNERRARGPFYGRSGPDALRHAVRKPYLAYPSRTSRDFVGRAYGLSLKQVRSMERDLNAMRAAVRVVGNAYALDGQGWAAAASYATRALQGSVLSNALVRAAQAESARSGKPLSEVYDRVRERFAEDFTRAIGDRVLRRAIESEGRETSRGAGAEIVGILSVLEASARSMAYVAVRGGMRGERDRSLDRDRNEMDRTTR